MLKIEDYANHMVHPDSAIILVDSIFANDHPSEKTVGLLQLFKAKAMFRKYYYTIDIPTGVDSIIASSVAILEKHGDKMRIAEAYAYQGFILGTYYDRPAEALFSLERARNVVADVEQPWTNNIVYDELATIYESLDNLDMSIECVKRGLQLQKKYKVTSAIIMGNHNLNVLYDEKNQQDSAEYYFHKVMRDSANFDSTEVPQFYETFGQYYFRHNQLQRAKYYFEQVPLSRNLALVQLYLARIARREHRPKDERFHMAKSIHIADSLEKTSDWNRFALRRYFRKLAYYYKETGDYRQESKTLEKLDSLNEAAKVYSITVGNKANQMERDYESNLLKAQHRKQVKTMLALIVVVALVLGFLIYVGVRKSLKAVRERLNRAKQKSYQQAYQIGKLKVQMEEMPATLTGKIAEGKLLFENIATGKTTMKDWNRADFDSYISYARFVDRDFFSELDKTHQKLSTKPLIFFYLWKKGMTDSEIARAMEVTNGSIRTMSYNIRKLHKSEKGNKK